MIEPADAVADAHRREWAFVLAATVRVAGDLDLAEECVQDAYVAALEVWTRQGVPGNPAAWLTTVARRRVMDAMRRSSTLRAKLPLLVEPPSDDPPPRPEAVPDDRLRMIFTCCHPALAREAQVALTLRLLCGLTTGEIADAFLVSEPTMAARVTRAKKKITGAGIPFRVPGPAELPDRLDAVLTVVHLVYTTGHTAPRGEGLVRADLTALAIDLARLVHALMPDEREATGLLALLVLLDARRGSRTDAGGRMLLLSEQDRSSWDRVAIEEGRELVFDALRGGRPGRFAVQAAIAALHAEAPSYEETDWEQVVGLYDVLATVWQSPVVALNRIAALSMAQGPERALAELTELADDPRLADYHYLPATRADLLRRLGRPEEAAAAYREALALTTNPAERDFLTRRLATL
ncbi:RNA polymerase sigma factor [Labedaea rhizosphaerae]|uniref:RNA polymerase sigma-70 factor (ECF subfamily) n=1 Tax=Labedaea rhizosphaerae TaxID=598644 RepID=A0A4R6S4D8_LABRH|nr:sigma-70 family RNA polymerase sigma factor [Labedaea rhizosphaerae]TDP93947.1 RNA polymerase sigma-70 factor (ECF subfamily) [Labedaea rhizosphaerae]